MSLLTNATEYNDMTITKNELATLATQVGTPTRDKAHEIVTDLCRGVYNPDQRDVLFAELYRYFMPKVPKKPKTGTDWVNLAMAKKDVRFYLNYGYAAANGDYVATDGQRLHILACGPREEGYYDTVGEKVEVSHTYVQYDRVVPKSPEKDAMRLSDLDQEVIVVKSRFPRNRHLVRLSMKGEERTRVNKALWEEALSGMEEPCVWVGDDKVVLLRDGDRTAVLMPVKT